MYASLEEQFRQRFRQIWRNVDLEQQANPLQSMTMLNLVDVAHQAFKAYRDPEIVTLEEATPDNNSIQYLNTDYLAGNVEGVLRIHLLRATNVENKDWGFWNKSDPYVVFSVGTSCVKSKVVYDDLNPVWETKHFLMVRKEFVRMGANDQLCVTLMDYDAHESPLRFIVKKSKLNTDDFLGSGSIDLNEVREPGVHSYDLHIGVGAKPDAQTIVTFTVEMISLEDACKEVNLTGTVPEWISEITEGKDLGTAWPNVSWLSELGRVPLDPVAYVTVPATDTQAWICVNRGTKSVRISFRGTETDKIRDPVMDFRTWQSELRSLCQDSIYTIKLNEEIKENSSIEVHNGFMRAYESVRESLMQLIYDITQWSDDWSICVTGHSLGGAIATLCAFEFANRKTKDNIGPHVSLITFGAPRVGNQAFADEYNKTVIESYRVVDKDDPVHVLPPCFVHTAKEVLCLSTGEMQIEQESLTMQTRSRMLVNTREGRHRVTDSGGDLNDILRRSKLRLSNMIKHHLRENYTGNLRKAASSFFNDRAPVRSDSES